MVRQGRIRLLREAQEKVTITGRDDRRTTTSEEIFRYILENTGGDRCRRKEEG